MSSAGEASHQELQSYEHIWESWKDFIYEQYIVNGKKLNEVWAELERFGFRTKKGQLETKVKSWKFCKNLTGETWRYSKHRFEERAAMGLKSILVLSGQRIPPEKVTFEFWRNSPPTMAPGPPPQAPENGFPLYICTPRGSSVTINHIVDIPEAVYPNSLPWFQFQKTLLPTVLRGIQLIKTPKKKSTVTTVGLDIKPYLLQIVHQDSTKLSNPIKSELLSAVVVQVLRKSLIITLGSEQLAMQLFARHSVDRIAAQFDLILPQSYPNENLHRAVELTGGNLPDTQISIIKIIFYLLSNRLMLDPDSVNLGQEQELIAICLLSGLADTRMVRTLVKLSQRSPTLTAIIDTLFEAAVHAEAPDFVTTLLKVDDRLHPDRRVAKIRWRFSKGGTSNHQTPIQFAFVRGSARLASVLLDAGANLPTEHIDNYSLLAAIITQHPDGSSRDLIRLLIQKGIPVREQGPQGRENLQALQAAIWTGQTDIMEDLIGAGANLNDRSTWKSYHSNGRFDQALNYMTDCGSLGMAASWNIGINFRPRFGFTSDEETALGLCREICNKYRSRIDVHAAATDGVIIAAGRGYTKVVSFLHGENPASIDTTNGYLSPIYAAVAWNRLGTCQQLLHLHVSIHTLPQTSHIDYKGHQCVHSSPSLLQLAVSRASCDIIQLLLQYGARVDETGEVQLLGRRMIYWPPICWASYTGKATVSPFRLAMRLERWDAACLLVKYGATTTTDDLVTAASEGQVSLAEQLITIGVASKGAVAQDTLCAAYNAALSNGHAVLVRHLAEYMAVHPAQVENAASLFRVLDVASIKTALPIEALESPLKLARDTKGCSYLENAILSGNKEVITFAFSLDPTAYDSGTLCAATASITREECELSQSDMILFLVELLRRRDNNLEIAHINYALENAALSMAVWRQRFDIVEVFLRSPKTVTFTLRSTINPTRNPNEETWDGSDLGMILGACVDPTLWPGIIARFDDWHASPLGHISPLLFSITSSSVLITQALLDAGYQADGFILRAAVEYDKPFEMIRQISNLCQDIDAECTRGFGRRIEMTPLYTAVEKGDTQVVQALLACGADINAVRIWPGDHRSTTALEVAVKTGNPHMAYLLLERGADVNNPTWSTRRPGVTTTLQLAAKAGYIGLVQRLLSLGADINARRGIYQGIGESTGYTALEAAASFGRIDIVQLLLDSGVDTEGYGRVQYVNAVFNASRNGHGATEQLLRSYRPWIAEDQAIWKHLEPHYDIFLHRQELSLAELLEVVEYLQDPDHYLLFSSCAKLAYGRVWHQGVAKLINKHAHEVATASSTSVHDTVERLAGVAFQTVQEWDEQRRQGNIASTTHADGVCQHAKKSQVSWPTVRASNIPFTWFPELEYDREPDTVDTDEEICDVVNVALQMWTSAHLNSMSKCHSPGMPEQGHMEGIRDMNGAVSPNLGAEIEGWPMEVDSDINTNRSTISNGSPSLESYQNVASNVNQDDRDWQDQRRRDFMKDLDGMEEEDYIAVGRDPELADFLSSARFLPRGS